MLVYRAGRPLADPRTGKVTPAGELIPRDFPGFDSLLQNGGVVVDRTAAAPVTKAAPAPSLEPLSAKRKRSASPDAEGAD